MLTKVLEYLAKTSINHEVINTAYGDVIVIRKFGSPRRKFSILKSFRKGYLITVIDHDDVGNDRELSPEDVISELEKMRRDRII